MLIETQYFLKRKRELRFSQTEELEALRAKYLADCEAVRRKYDSQYSLLKALASPATVQGPQ